MSRAGQTRLLSKLLDEIDSENIEAYRRSTADKQTHIFKVSRRSIRKGIRDYLLKQFSDEQSDTYLTKTQIASILKSVDPEVYALIKKSGTEIQKWSKGKDSQYYTLHKFTKASILATFDAKGSSRYDKIFQMYSKDLNKIGSRVAEELTKKFSKSVEVKGRNIGNLSHAEFEGIVESAVADAVENALKEETDISYTQLTKFLKKRGVDLRIIRKTSTGTMLVGLASAVENQEDNAATKARLSKLRKVLIEALEELERTEQALSGLKGSDSFQDRHRKQVLKTVKTAFDGIADVDTEDIVFKESSGPTKLSKSGKTTTKKYRRGFQKKKPRNVFTGRGRSIASEPLYLIGILNKELPRVVRGNMGAPGLENRSGRFAQSVEVTDITKTPKGFPSIGYTYRKSPYQTFEMGNKQGSKDRDPRTLIDKSIREVAIHFALGRFYTRRI